MKCADLYSYSRLVTAVVSPDGQRVAYVKKTPAAPFVSYERELGVCDIAGRRAGAVRSVARAVRSPAWAPDGSRLAAIAEGTAGGGESIVVFDTDDWRLVREFPGIGALTSLTWSPNSRQLAFLALVSSQRDGSGAAEPVIASDLSMKLDGVGILGEAWERRLLVVDLATGAIRRVVVPTRWVDSFCYSPAGDFLVVCGAASAAPPVPYQPGTVRPSALWVMKPDGSDTRRLTDGRSSARCPSISSEGEIVFVGLTTLAAGLLGLFAVPLSGGRPRELASGLDRSVTVGGSDSQDGHPPIVGRAGEIFFCARDGGCVYLYRTNLRDDSVEVLAGSPVQSIKSVSLSSSPSRLCYIVSSSSGAQAIEVRERDGATTPVATCEPVAGLIAPEPVAFQARDGQALAGWLIRRRGAGQTPLLVDVHGGSFSGAWSPVYDPSRLYHQELAASGWTVLLLNARGSDGYGKEFAEAALGAWGAADGDDFHAAIDALVDEGLVDERQLAITGYSYGGFISNWMTATSGRFAAAVAGGAICNFISLFGTSDMGWAMCQFDIGVCPDRDPVRALRQSPVMGASNVTTPTLLLHGEADMRCPISQAEEWFALLFSTGCLVELVRYPGASHDFLSEGEPRFIVDYGQRLIDWVREHVEARKAPSNPDGTG